MINKIKMEKKANAVLSKNEIIVQGSNYARLLLKKGFGEINGEFIYLSSYETLFLLEKNKISLFDRYEKEITAEQFFKAMIRKNPDFPLNYVVFKDLRDKDYVVKAGAKYGALFRVYEKGILPGKEHARWLVIPVKSEGKLVFEDILGKNRIANSTRKSMLLAFVDNDNTVTYLELKWRRM